MSAPGLQATRRRLAGIAAVLFTLAFAGTMVAQLSLMSVLNTGRASRAAETVASSQLVGNTIQRAVREAVTPVAGQQVADQLAAAAAADARVRTAVRVAVIEAHRSIVDPDAAPDGSVERANAAVAASITEAGELAGVDVSGPAAQLQVPQLDAGTVPAIGLRSLAETTRLVGAIAAIVGAAVCVTVHPRRGRAVSTLGWCAGGVCVAWAAALWLTTWTIDRVDDTVVGELLDELWQLAVPSMLGLLAAGALIGASTWLGGRALDGLAHGGRR
jgi:hypothetical protein